VRKIISSTFISLNGVIKNPQNWHFDSFDEAGQAFAVEQLRASDALLMGRETYDSYAQAWPTRSGDPMSDQINAMRKYVVSSTLERPTWANTVVIADNVAEEIKRLKNEPGEDILQHGFGDVTYLLLEHGLLDEVVLWFHPIFVGSAKPEDLLFRECADTTFDLVSTDVHKGGIVILSYRVRKTDRDEINPS
jgi:dihydrofolate reductase